MINIVRVSDKQKDNTYRCYCGRHGKGAALIARQKFGAVYGLSQGHQVYTYAIVTKDLSSQDKYPLHWIKEGIIKFLRDANDTPSFTYLVTKIGCGLGGYTINEIANLFIGLDIPDNVVLPKEFWDVINNQEESKMKTNVNEPTTMSLEPIGIIRPIEVKVVKPELKEIPNMTYAGIGSRRTDGITLLRMTDLANELETLGFKLYSGAADGADKAFSDGCTNKVELIPWKGFNNCYTGIVPVLTDELLAIAESVHPAWNKCSQGAKKLHARNCHQILGHDLKSPVDFVLCWTPDGAETKTGYNTGGTGQAIRLAIQRGIPVINMYNNDWKQRLDVLLEDIHILNQARVIELSTY